MVQVSRLDSAECCTYCEHPIHLCRSASCDDAATYQGVLHMSQWVEVEADTFVSAE